MIGIFLRITKIINRAMSVIAMIVLVVMVLLTTIDVLGRYLFNKPVQGTFELTEIMLASIVFCSLAFCQFGKGHIAVDIVVSRFSQKVQKAIQTFNYIITIFVLGMIAIMSFENGMMIKESQDVTMILEIPIYPFIFLVSIGSAGMALEVLRDIVLTWSEETV
jgi:TRAP-type C4-dicarboxylate transport system permease small subunit